ncbi:MAG: acetyl-CoA carboxylase biotin carboxyl carrier protein [Verrucomicrobia bacterium]|nr:acetyl-CoA carboxylase biotin carboxyl carrier protein [Verrucomicrobiota bacterium]
MEFDGQKIEDLMVAMERHGMTRLSVKIGESHVELERLPNFAFAPPSAPPLVSQSAPSFTTLEAPPPPALAPGDFIHSPMVGTFYASPSPEAEPFVKVGDTVNEETVVCIVEAMKVMNEVKAGKRGVIREFVVDSGHPVEFGTKLFRIG